MYKKITKSELKLALESRFFRDKIKKVKDLPSPFMLKDMDRATKRIKKAIDAKEKIAIVGDYDADGVVSCAIVYLFFKEIGVSVDIIIPDRFSDGYGLSKSVASRVEQTLVITVDNGISELDSALLLKDRGIDLIITDHHTIKSALPDAYAIINPKRDDCEFPFKDICGAQVAWYLCAALKSELNANVDLGLYLDILSIAIVGDVMPLVCLNRAMLKVALKSLNSSNRAPIRAIKERLNTRSFDAQDIGFKIAPRINSAGRIKSAYIAFEFLIESDFYKALKLFDELDLLNKERKELEERITQSAIKEVDSKADVIVVASRGWSEGVIGIVAARLVSLYNKSAIVFSISKDGSRAKGSARSYGEQNILEIIGLGKDMLIGYGGHKKAAGLAIKSENLESFKNRLSAIPKEYILDLHSKSEVIGSVNLEEIDGDFLEILESAKPYGEGNPMPEFYCDDLIVEDIMYSKDSKHTFFNISSRSKKRSFRATRFSQKVEIEKDAKISAIFTLDRNIYRGSSNYNINILDLQTE